MRRSDRIVALAAIGALATVTGSARAQLSLTPGGTYTQNFDSIGGGLPTGWSGKTGASVSILGTDAVFNSATASWTATAGGFKNVASYTAGAAATATDQANATDRAFGARQTGTAGFDPGMAFVLTLSNTAGYDLQSLSLDIMTLTTLAQSPRNTTWTVDYRVGTTGSFSSLGTYTNTDTFGAQTLNIDLSPISALDNALTNVYFRVAALAGSTGSGSRDTTAIDNFTLTYTGSGATTTPRNLTWNGAAGNWESTDNWLDGATPATWANANPDNAILGAPGIKTVTLGAPQVAGSLTITAPGYTVTGSTLTVFGAAGTGVVANESATIASTLAVGSPQTWTVAADKTLTIAGTMELTGQVTKDGPGTVDFTGPATTTAGTFNVNGGRVRVSAVDGNGSSALGAPTMTIGNGGTFEIAGVNLGTSTGTTAPILNMGNGSTLLASGQSSLGRSGGFNIVNGTASSQNIVDVKTVNASDVFAFKNSLRQASTAGTDTFATIRVGGPGRIVLESGATSANTSFAGSWEITSGNLQIGPLAPGGAGELMNALGYKQGDTKNANAVRVSGGILSVAVSGSTQGGAPDFLRSPVTLAGGAIAATNGADANFGGSLITEVGTTSRVLTYDPVNPGQTRSIRLVAGAAGENNNESGLNWGGTLVVDPGTTTGGNLQINRTGGTVEVTPGASMQILSGAEVLLQGTADALHDGTDAVAVVNNGLLAVNAGDKTIGALTGTGTTHVNTTLRIKAGSAASSQNAMAFNSLLDLKDNDLTIVTGTGADQARSLLASGRGSGAWDGSSGITTSLGTATRGIGYSGGESSALFLKYTYMGDANLDGRINGDDYALIDKNFALNTSNAHWTQGDFNYNGVVNSEDYFLIDSAFGNQSGVLSPALLSQRASQFGDGYVAALVASVPEPTTLGLVGAAAVALAGRRRRVAR